MSVTVPALRPIRASHRPTFLDRALGSWPVVPLAARGGRSLFSAKRAAQPVARFCDVLGSRCGDTVNLTWLLTIPVPEQQQ